MFQVVAQNVIPLVFMIITPVLALLVAKALQKLATKWHIESALQYQGTVNDLVIKGIQAVEQKSLAAVKKGGAATPSETKLNDAMTFVTAQLTSMGLPGKASAELSTLVESHLFSGASGPATPPVPVAVVAPVASPAT